MTQPGNPLATADQRESECCALRLFERSDIRLARERARARLLADPAATTMDGRIGLERALDLWMTALCMREANGDPAHPKVSWNVDNTPRCWFGHIYPGGAVAVDNPDNMNREMPLDGDGVYELTVEFAANPSSLSLVLEIEPRFHAGIGENVATLSTLDLDPQPGKQLTVSLSSLTEGHGDFHMQLRPGERHQLYARDSHADWAQVPAAIEIRRTDAVSQAERSEDKIAAAVVAATPAWVDFWVGFKDSFLGYPEPNQLVGPLGRAGGWQFLSGGRFRLGEGQGILVRTHPAGSAYTGFQVTDPYTMAPDPVRRTSSLNSAQVTPDADGGHSYVVAAHECGAANWIDTCGLTEGWMLLRWQGTLPDTDPATLVREVRLIDLDSIPGDVPRATIAERAAALELRARLHRARTQTGEAV